MDGFDRNIVDARKNRRRLHPKVAIKKKKRTATVRTVQYQLKNDSGFITYSTVLFSCLHTRAGMRAIMVRYRIVL